VTQPIGGVTTRVDAPAIPVRSRTLAPLPVRVSVAVLVVLVAVGAQLSLAPQLDPVGVLPNFVLLTVVAAALARGRDFAAVLGFVLGVAMDLGPASDHVAGRWALALVIVGYVVGSTSRDGFGHQPRRLVLAGTAGTASFIGSSLFALSGLALGQVSVAVPDMVRMIGAASLTDAVLGFVVLPFLIVVFERLRPARVVL
jgi:rod shape-determining protein MreD